MIPNFTNLTNQIQLGKSFGRELETATFSFADSALNAHLEDAQDELRALRVQFETIKEASGDKASAPYYKEYMIAAREMQNYLQEQIPNYQLTHIYCENVNINDINDITERTDNITDEFNARGLSNFSIQFHPELRNSNGDVTTNSHFQITIDKENAKKAGEIGREFVKEEGLSFKYQEPESISAPVVEKPIEYEPTPDYDTSSRFDEAMAVFNDFKDLMSDDVVEDISYSNEYENTISSYRDNLYY